MPGGSIFFDTNILLYVHDRGSEEKRNVAKSWLAAATDRQHARINLQVLNELTNVLLRKQWFDSPNTVFSVVETFAVLGDGPLTRDHFVLARMLHLRIRYSWWDCLLLASALELGCRWFLSEDLQDGQTIEGLTIVDPFAHSPEQILTSL